MGTESNSRLVFEAEGAEDLEFTGVARAGDVSVPMSLTADVELDGEEAVARLAGTAHFEDVRIPLPGLSRIRAVDVQVSGELLLMRA